MFLQKLCNKLSKIVERMQVASFAANSSEVKQIVDSMINSGMRSRASVTIVFIIEKLLELHTVNKGVSGLNCRVTIGQTQ